MFQWLTFLLLPALVDGRPWGHKGHQGSRLRGTEDWTRCGILGKGANSENPKTRIVHGQDADQCVWRWQVSISTPRDQFCGGSLIAPDWVLTAAHCVTPIKGACAVRALQIRAGGRTRAPGGSEVTRHAKKIFVHPLYSQNVAHDYDFAIIKLDKAMPLNECIGTVCLPRREEKVGTNCNITGWGTLREFGETPTVLQQAAVTLLPDSDCERNYRVSKDVITGSMLCASGFSEKGVVDSCQGDSGGPLSCKESGHFVLRGVTSWGQGCALRQFPGVYGKVESVMSWIEDVTRNKVRASLDDQHQEGANISGIEFNGSMWTVVKGNCTKDVPSGCIMSPGYPGNYTEQSFCVIAVNSSAAVPIKVVNFSTEEKFDALISDCRYFSGSKGPDGLVPHGPIFWYSDDAVVSSGWKLCPERQSSAVQTSRQSP